MNYQKIQLEDQNTASVTLYLHETVEAIPIGKRPVILVIPGGGYNNVSEREAEVVASAFYAHGFHTAVLRYSVLEGAKGLQPQKEGFLALKKLKENSRDWNIDENKILVCGFSAGGHLAGCLGTMWKEPRLLEMEEFKNGLVRPDGMILCYPVIKSGKYAHEGSFYYLTGGSGDKKEEDFYSIEKRVDENTPPVFIWQTRTDDCVPVENSLVMVQALQEKKVPYEAHIFNGGNHGMSMCTEECGTPHKHVGSWFPLCLEWIKEVYQY